MICSLNWHKKVKNYHAITYISSLPSIIWHCIIFCHVCHYKILISTKHGCKNKACMISILQPILCKNYTTMLLQCTRYYVRRTIKRRFTGLCVGRKMLLKRCLTKEFFQHLSTYMWTGKMPL